MFYDNRSRENIKENIEKPESNLRSASEASMLRLLDVLSLQMNELQRLNNTVESILEIIQLEQQSQ